jgi:choline transporter-like protein 2/4/5
VEVLQKLMVYLIRNAYIIIAKEGTPFLDSGKKAFRLIKENIMDVIVLNQIGDIVLFVCRLFITLIAGLVGYVVLSTVMMMIFWFFGTLT